MSLEMGKGKEGEQVAQGQYMWSAIPVALLCIIVNRSEEKQGSGPKGDKVLYNTGGLSFVLPEEVDKML